MICEDIKKMNDDSISLAQRKRQLYCDFLNAWILKLCKSSTWYNKKSMWQKKMVQNLLSSQKKKKMDNKMMHYLKTATNINSKVGIFLGNAIRDKMIFTVDWEMSTLNHFIILTKSFKTQCRTTKTNQKRSEFSMNQTSQAYKLYPRMQCVQFSRSRNLQTFLYNLKITF